MANVTYIESLAEKGTDCRGYDLHNLRETARTPLTVTVHLETQVVEDNFHSVMNVFMVVDHDIRTEPIHEINTFPLRCYHSSRRENCDHEFPKKLVPNWPTFTTTVGYEVQERPPLQILRLVDRRNTRSQTFLRELNER